MKRENEKYGRMDEKIKRGKGKDKTTQLMRWGIYLLFVTNLLAHERKY
jgi:hypothetical protein